MNFIEQETIYANFRINECIAGYHLNVKIIFLSQFYFFCNFQSQKATLWTS